MLKEDCPFRQVMVVITEKWCGCVLYTLSKDICRPGEMGRAIPGISKKMLTQTLRSLEKMGMIERMVYEQIPPKVEYKLTDTGRHFLVLLKQVHEWAGGNADIVRTAYNAKSL